MISRRDHVSRSKLARRNRDAGDFSAEREREIDREREDKIHHYNELTQIEVDFFLFFPPFIVFDSFLKLALSPRKSIMGNSVSEQRLDHAEKTGVLALQDLSLTKVF